MKLKEEAKSRQFLLFHFMRKAQSEYIIKRIIQADTVRCGNRAQVEEILMMQLQLCYGM